MKTNIYAVHDAKAGAYGAPFPVQTNGLATRGFIQACLNEQSPYGKHPLDYTLFRVGVYDDETSIIKSECPPELIVTAMQAIMISEKESQKIIEATKENTENEISNGSES